MMKKNILIYILYLIILTICVANFSFSRYETSVEGTDEARVAKAVFDCVPVSAVLNGETMTGISDGVTVSNAEPGTELIYTFNICNFSDTDINEVHLNYNIQVEFSPSTPALPLTYTLQTSGGGTYPEGSWVDMGYGTPSFDTYILTVNWDESDDGEEYLDTQQTIKIKMTVEQLDS
jgi:hypothetical protein